MFQMFSSFSNGQKRREKSVKGNGQTQYLNSRRKSRLGHTSDMIRYALSICVLKYVNYIHPKTKKRVVEGIKSRVGLRISYGSE